EHGIIQPKTPGTLILDVPAGQIRIEYQKNGDRVENVRIFNIASYLAHRDVSIEVEGLGELTVDVSYGGNYYTIIEPQKNFAGLEHFSADQVLHYSPKVRDAINQVVDCVHPD
ncbi:proline racemase family protein, partial [Enterobacter hormaechei]|nr:proline racemase family protein [Enterobacter hormaechei]